MDETKSLGGPARVMGPGSLVTASIGSPGGSRGRPNGNMTLCRNH